MAIKPSGENNCPKCGAAFPKRPTRKTKCQSCGEFIFVQEGRLMTVDRIAKEKIDRIRANDINYLGFSMEQFLAREQELMSALGYRPAFIDVIIELVANKVTELKVLDDGISKFSGLHILYSSAADILQREGRDPRQMRRLGHLFNAMLCQKIGFKRLAFFAREGSCDQCVALSGRAFPADEMIRFLETLSGDDPSLCCCYLNEAK
jgi:hypothetical protein